MIEDADSGFSIARLAYRHPKDPLANLEARVALTAGANLFSLTVGEDQLLLQPETLRDLAEQRAGTPIMFPTPNRVRDARTTFEGRSFDFEPNSGANFIHGLARRCPFRAGRLATTGASAAAEAVLDWDPQQRDFARFPIRHRLTVTFTLRRAGLRIGYRVDNRDDSRLPFGFGVHPYFRIPEARAGVFVQVPLARRMESQDYLPTGKLLPVAGTAHDLRRRTALTGLALDDVYFGMVPGKEAAFELPERRLRVTLSGTADLTHLVIYTPPDRNFFCIENQTCSTDAHNLASAGARKVAHLQVVAPGKRAAGHINWTIRRAPLRPDKGR
jgi:aldose 1-epimerase